MKSRTLLALVFLGACASIGAAPTPVIDPRQTPEEAGLAEPIYNRLLELQTGELLEPRVFGGAPAKVGDDPWQVALIVANSQVPNDVYCGGALIRPTWVLTAAHCVAYGTPASEVQAVEGTNNLAAGGDGRRLRVARIIRHPQFVPTPRGSRDVRNFNDIALLELQDSAWSPAVDFAGPELDQIADGTAARVTGWGRTRLSRTSDLLQYLDVEIVSNANCGRPTVHGARIRGTMLCAMKPDTRTGFCQGDSGGPLTIARGDSRTLVGVVSIGEQSCNIRNIPGVYTRVSSFARWISDCVEGREAGCRTG